MIIDIVCGVVGMAAGLLFGTVGGFVLNIFNRDTDQKVRGYAGVVLWLMFSATVVLVGYTLWSTVYGEVVTWLITALVTFVFTSLFSARYVLSEMAKIRAEQRQHKRAERNQQAAEKWLAGGPARQAELDQVNADKKSAMVTLQESFIGWLKSAFASPADDTEANGNGDASTC